MSDRQPSAPFDADVLVIGAGAAGLFCAARAGQAGARVLLVDHADKVAEKIRISGGGRSNFTNRDAGPAHYLSSNPHFCRSALARYTAADFIALMQRHRVPFHEKHKGQLFCDESSEDLIALLLRECEAGRVTRWQPCGVGEVQPSALGAGADASMARFRVDTTRGEVRCRHLVVATGGLSIPKIGASDFGYRLARQFGHQIVATRPALVPLTFDPVQWSSLASLSGLSLPVSIRCGEGQFNEDLLFTHRGLSGPAILQISSYWTPGTDLVIDLAPGVDLQARLLQAKQGSRKRVVNELATLLPERLASAWLQDDPTLASRPVAEASDKALRALAASLQAWRLRPANTEGYRKAEVTAGGVDTRELSSRTMESRLVPGLYFIGEVVDVTGWLGGYNFQWAWSSAAACAEAMTAAMA